MSPSTPRPGSSASYATPLLRSAGERWRGGAMVALITAFALPLWWRIDDSVFEAVALVEPTPSALPAQGETERRRLSELAEQAARERRPPPGLGFSPDPEPAATLEERDGRQLALTCRGQSPQAAEALCDQLLHEALPPGSALRLVNPNPRAARATSLLRWPVILAGAGAALTAGLLWMLVGALLARRGRSAASRGEVPVVGIPAFSGDQLSFEQLPERWNFALWPGLQAGASAPPMSAGEGRADALQLLCDEAEQLSRQGAALIGFTSAPEDRVRKAYSAAQFASLLAARRRARVLLLEGDFEEPAVDRVMQVNMPPMGGFSQQLQWRDPANPGLSWSVVQVGSHLSVLAEGRVRVLGQVQSERFIAAVAQLKRQYDILIMDGPTLAHPADAMRLDRIASGLVFVSSGRANLAAVRAELARSYSEKALFALLVADPAAG